MIEGIDLDICFDFTIGQGTARRRFTDQCMQTLHPASQVFIPVDELKVIATELVMKVRQSVMINYTEHAWPASLDTAGLNTP